MRKISAVLFALCALARLASAQWQIESSRSDPSVPPGVEHRHLALRNSATGENAALELALFSSKTATLRVLENAEARDDLAGAMVREKCIAGVNGGYFDPEFAPVGLLISDGRMVAPLRKARLLSGVVGVVNGRVQIQRPAEFSLKTKASAARQCGPFLVERSKAITGLNETRPARRTFVATMSDGRAALGFSSAVTLQQLADMLALSEWKIQRALNLDGGSSSAFWFNGKEGVVSISERKTVRDFLAIVPRF